jgi:hypothetical protein
MIKSFPTYKSFQSKYFPKYKGVKSNAIIITVQNAHNIGKKFQKYMRAKESLAQMVLRKCLIKIETEAIFLINKGYYQPAVDTGLLRNSITHQTVVLTLDYYEGRVGTNVYYSIFVHEGTKQKYGLQAKTSSPNNQGSSYFNPGLNSTGWHMPPRPFLADALEKKKDEIIADIKREIFGYPI